MRTINSATAEWKIKTLKKKKLQSIMIVTFTKLFVTRIVANNNSESLSKLFIFLSDEWFSSSISFKSEGDNEKKAISDADAKPDTPNKRVANIIAIMADTEGVVTDILNASVNTEAIKQGSGSKI